MFVGLQARVSSNRYIIIIQISEHAHLFIITLFFSTRGRSGRSSPLDPVRPPRLIPDHSTVRAGQFIVDLSEAAPQPLESQVVNRTNISAVTFLFRFVDLNSSVVFFNWTVS